LISVVSIFLILILIIAVILIRKSNTDVVYPPKVSNCPDYWNETYDKDDPTKKGKCFNEHNLGTCRPDKPIDFSKMTMCDKQKWTQKCDTSWDGISNSTNACGMY
jgi:hypothetical protein